MAPAAIRPTTPPGDGAPLTPPEVLLTPAPGLTAALVAPAPAERPALDAPPPRPLGPLGGAVVDGTQIAFSWSGTPDVSGYRLQISPDRQFRTDVVDVTTGPATEVALVRTLPAASAPVFWRVRAETAAGATRWSPYGRFVSGTTEAADAYRLQQEEAAQQAKREEARARADAEAAADLVPAYQRADAVTRSADTAMIVTALLAGGAFTVGAIVFGFLL